MKRILFALTFIYIAIFASAKLTPEQCQGSLGPYPAVKHQAAAPDSLTPVCLVHVGRHGSRFPAGSYSANTMLKALNKADSLRTLTPLGMQFKRLIENVIIRSVGRWGALDSIGMAEQRGIARRTMRRCRSLFKTASLEAIASHSPRAIMSMYSFTHEVAKHAGGISIHTTSGKECDALVRPFDCDPIYKAYMQAKPYIPLYDSYLAATAPNTVTRLLGAKYPATKEELQQLSIIEYYNIANMKAMGMDHHWQPYLSEDEYEQLWSCFNLRQYFMHCANQLSAAPANQAKPLLRHIIEQLTAGAVGGTQPRITAYIAHQETLMPLLSLLKIEGTQFSGSDLAKLKDQVQDFHLCPMAANLQFTLYRGHSGRLYLRCDLNEHIISLQSGGE
ncbi:MAG: hypothetical protein Q4B68_05420, partial [Bacteroidales bacterium]|nr:hypothetical protein [Bacteroidales bacterium]